MKTIEISSDSSTQFTSLLAQNEVETETLYGIRADGNGLIRNISILSVDNLAWQVELYSASGGIIGKIAIPSTEAVLVTVDGVDYYAYTYQVEWYVPQASSTLTCTLGVRNLSAASKSGALILTIIYNIF